MKSIVFLSKDGICKHKSHKFRHTRPFTPKRFFYYYGIQTFFMMLFVVGIFLGAFYLKNANDVLFQKLDFLFITNLNNRVKLSLFNVFCSSLASNFIFVFTAFLLAFSAWGYLALPFLCMFRGFGVGLSSAYLFTNYALTGIGFYILVLLPGTVLFLLAFIMMLKESLLASVSMFRLYFTSKSDSLSSKYKKAFFVRNSIVLVFIAFSSFVDMILWVLFANMFKF